MSQSDVQDAAPEAFFQAAMQAFAQAAQGQAGVCERFYCLCGERVCLRFAGPALISRITPALEHLTAAAGPAALTVCLWDSASTGAAMPPPPWTLADRLPRSEIRGYCTDRFLVGYHPGSGVLSLLDRRERQAVAWVRDAGQLPYYESGAPLLAILNGWLADRGRQVVHAGAVGTSDGGALLVGRGGSGKSTTAITCLGSALGYAADDYCAVSLDPVPTVHSLYSSAKVNAPDIGRFPHLDPALSNRDRLGHEKALYFLAEHQPEALTAGFPLRAILLPFVTGQAETRVTPVSAGAALQALAPSTVFQLPGAGEEDLRRLGALVRRVPSYRLALGTDRSILPDTIRRILAGT